MAQQRGIINVIAISISAALTPLHAGLATGTIRLECRWSARFDTSTNQTSAATGRAIYTIRIREGNEIEIRRADLDPPLIGRANAEQFSATADYKIEGLPIQEFVAIHRRTGAIEAWTMMGEAGGAFAGECYPITD